MIELLQTPNFWIGFGSGGVCIAILFLAFLGWLGAIDETAVDKARDADDQRQHEQYVAAERERLLDLDSHPTGRQVFRREQAAGRAWRGPKTTDAPANDDPDGFAQQLEVQS